MLKSSFAHDGHVRPAYVPISMWSSSHKSGKCLSDGHCPAVTCDTWIKNALIISRVERKYNKQSLLESRPQTHPIGRKQPRNGI